MPSIIALPSKPVRTNWINNLVLLAALGLFGYTIYRAAWLGDDAFITFRTVDNFLNGYGLTWNTTERVQGYSHPLWMFVISAAVFFTREFYFTVLYLCMAISTVAMILSSTWVAPFRITAAFGILVLCLSNAFVDYSAAGLENPLTHLLLVLFFGVYFHQEDSPIRLLLLSLLISLIGINRLDSLLLVLPAAAFVLFSSTVRQRGYRFFAGLAPLLAWHIFSLLYYGFPFPNTAYAKLHLNIPITDLVAQGIAYFLDSLQRDPVTLWFIAAGIIIGLTAAGKPGRMAAVGIILYLAYILRIGGDFMSGRFFTAPLLLAVLLIGQIRSINLNGALSSLPVILLLVLEFASPARAKIDLETRRVENMINTDGIADERRFYELENGLRWKDENPTLPNFPWRYDGERHAGEKFKAIGCVGMFGFYAGPGIHIVDTLALTDPLLARMPVKEGKWRVGHYERVIPPGYFETIKNGQNQIEDLNVAIYYDTLSLITRGALFDPGRLRAIWEMNTGQYEYLLNAVYP
jgi:arabinofuranosyltransferase